MYVGPSGSICWGIVCILGCAPQQAVGCALQPPVSYPKERVHPLTVGRLSQENPNCSDVALYTQHGSVECTADVFAVAELLNAPKCLLDRLGLASNSNRMGQKEKESR